MSFTEPLNPAQFGSGCHPAEISIRSPPEPSNYSPTAAGTELLKLWLRLQYPDPFVSSSPFGNRTSGQVPYANYIMALLQSF